MSGRSMTTKLILIVLAAAAFGWGFSALVQHSDRAIRPENARLACQDWTADGCASPSRR